MGCQIEKLSRAEKTRLNIAYGCDELEKLKSVLVHTPGDEPSLINESNYKHWLFDKVPDISGYIEEHRSYQELLESNGVKVYELEDHVDENVELIRKMPNYYFFARYCSHLKKKCNSLQNASACKGKRGDCRKGSPE
jgi:arginine deiminase